MLQRVEGVAGESWAQQILRDGTVELAFWLALLALLIAVAIYLAEKIRAKPAQQEPPASQLLSKCREWHSQGGLSDEEFRTIKTTLTTQLQQELRDSDETA